MTKRMPASPPRGIILVAFLILAGLWLGAGSPAGAVDFPRSRLAVETATGSKFSFEIEVAETPEQLQQGLMFRDRLPENSGMLFLLGSEQVATFWMRNTFVPLDIIFVGRGGRIVNIHPRAVPGSGELLTSDRPVIAVLEINAGLAARLGIRAGDRLVHSAFN